MDKVNILLSSYNGEKHIREQLDSLLAQDYENFEIHIRDDASKDGTRKILEEYQSNYPDKIFVYFGENLGYKKSFQWLLQHCGNADYFSFCDQDDYWYSDKISRGIELLKESEKKNVPLIYLCNFYWCDEALKREKQNDGYKRYHSIEKYITLGDRNAFGFTEIFNKVALDGVKDSLAFEGCSHDELVYMYCMCKGDVIWDSQVCADYRRHGGNVSKLELVGGNKFTHLLWRIRTFLFSNNKEEIYQRIKIFYNNFSGVLNEDTRKIYELYLGNKGRIRKFLLNKRYRDTLFDEIAIRFLFLMGKV